jgi:hypothetical protein
MNKALTTSSESIASYPGLHSSTLMTGNIGLWHLDESSGSFLDSSASAHHATASGGVTRLTSAKFGGGVQLDGTGSLTVASSADYRFTSAESFTFSAWVYIDKFDTLPSAQAVISMGGDFGIAISADALWVLVGPNGTINTYFSELTKMTGTTSVRPATGFRQMKRWHRPVMPHLSINGFHFSALRWEWDRFTSNPC